jgi:hypothetical protein
MKASVSGSKFIDHFCDCNIIYYTIYIIPIYPSKKTCFAEKNISDKNSNAYFVHGKYIVISYHNGSKSCFDLFRKTDDIRKCVSCISDVGSDRKFCSVRAVLVPES